MRSARNMAGKTEDSRGLRGCERAPAATRRLRSGYELCPLSRRGSRLQQIFRSKSVSNNIRDPGPRGPATPPGRTFRRMNPLLMTLRTTNPRLPYNKLRRFYVRLDLFIQRPMEPGISIRPRSGVLVPLFAALSFDSSSFVSQQTLFLPS